MLSILLYLLPPDSGKISLIIPKVHIINRYIKCNHEKI